MGAFLLAALAIILIISMTYSPWLPTEENSMTDWLMVILTGLATLLVWRTVIYTKGALKEAKAATIAANEAVKETRRIGEAQTRAYLTTEKGQIYSGEVSGNLAFKIAVEIKNSGQSPAFGIRVAARISINGNTIINPFDARAHCKIIGAEGIGTAESQNYIFQGQAFPPKFKQGNSFVVLGKIHWKDVFGGIHETEFELREEYITGFSNPNMGIIQYDLIGASMIMLINGKDLRRETN